MEINEKEMLAQATAAHEKLLKKYKELGREFGGPDNIGLPSFIDLLDQFAVDPITGGTGFGFSAENCANNAEFYRQMLERGLGTVGDVRRAFEERVFDPKEVHDWVQADMLRSFEISSIKKGYPEFTHFLETYSAAVDEVDAPRQDPDELN